MTLLDLKKDYNDKLKIVNKQIDWIDKHPTVKDLDKYIKILEMGSMELSEKILYIKNKFGLVMTSEQILNGFKYSELI